MPIPRQAPRRIDVHEDVRYVRVVENLATQRLLRLRFVSKLQHDEKRYGSVRSSQFTGGTKHLLCDSYAAFDGGFGAIGHDQLRQRCESRMLLGREPYKVRT